MHELGSQVISGTCLTTGFNGRIASATNDTLVVESAVGPMTMVINASTRFAELDDPPGSAARVRVTEPGWGPQDLIGHQVMGRLVSYPGSEGKCTLLCTELSYHAQRGGRPCYLVPDFWRELLTRLGDWWREKAVDPQEGGYFTNLTQQGLVPPESTGQDKWGYVVARTLYALCSAFTLSGEMRFLEAASMGAAFLRERVAYLHDGHLLFRTRLHRAGEPYSEHPPLINIFSQIYTLTGLVAYYEATRCPLTASTIDGSLRSLALLFRDTKHGGFYDAINCHSLAVEHDVTDSKSFNSIVDPLSAVLYFLSNVGFPTTHLACNETIRELCSLVLTHFVDRTSPFIREVFRRDWRYEPPNWANPYNTAFIAGNVGGNMKTVWVLLRAWKDLDGPTRDRAREAIDHIHRNIVSSGAWDEFRGGWFDVMRRDTPLAVQAQHLWHSNKVWWQQEEGILACLLSFLIWRRPEHLNVATDGVRFFLAHFIDRTYGGVFDTVSMDGLPVVSSKGSWLKGGYHETELARYLYIYLSALQGSPVTFHYRVNGRAEVEMYCSVPARIHGLKWVVLDAQIVHDDVLRVRYAPRWEEPKTLGGTQ
jgi:mannose/cellobiose epimerase-like protein (N-acyl-D-glucosamine 2-epimerase family)